jgi:hypothetical protein
VGFLNSSKHTKQQISFIKNNSNNNPVTQGFSALGRFWNHRNTESNASKINDASNNASIIKPNYAINSDAFSSKEREPSITNFLTEQQSFQSDLCYNLIQNRED